jgi:DnaJ-class molecular chaperone
MSKRFKSRWIYKAVIWKVLSAVTGALVVLGLTGEYKTSWQYLAIYVPITLVLFVLLEFSFQTVKIRRRCSACDGTGIARIFRGTCEVCSGTGEKCTSRN